MGTCTSRENILSESNTSSKIEISVDENIAPRLENNGNVLLCRICLEDENSGELIDPCECSGTMKIVHTKCLEKWLSTSNSSQCEICKYPFLLERKNKPIYQWWRETKRWKGLLADFICLIVLTPLCSIASYMCGLGATSYKSLKIWEGFALAMLCCMLISTYFLWLLVVIRFYYKSWKHWCNLNQDVTLLKKHRNPNEPRRKIRITEQESDQENYTVNMDRIFPWFYTQHSAFDLYMHASYV